MDTEKKEAIFLGRINDTPGAPGIYVRPGERRGFPDRYFIGSGPTDYGEGTRYFLEIDPHGPRVSINGEDVICCRLVTGNEEDRRFSLVSLATGKELLDKPFRGISEISGCTPPRALVKEVGGSFNYVCFDASEKTPQGTYPRLLPQDVEFGKSFTKEGLAEVEMDGNGYIVDTAGKITKFLSLGENSERGTGVKMR